MKILQNTPVKKILCRYTSEKKKYQKAALGLQDSDEDDHEQVAEAMVTKMMLTTMTTMIMTMMCRRSTPRSRTCSRRSGRWKLWTEHPRKLLSLLAWTYKRIMWKSPSIPHLFYSSLLPWYSLRLSSCWHHHLSLLTCRTPATMGVNGKKDHVPVPMDKLAMAKQMAAKLTAKTATINKSEVSFVTIVPVTAWMQLWARRWRRRRKALFEGQEGLLGRASLQNLLQVTWLLRFKHVSVQWTVHIYWTVHISLSVSEFWLFVIQISLPHGWMRS